MLGASKLEASLPGTTKETGRSRAADYFVCLPMYKCAVQGHGLGASCQKWAACFPSLLSRRLTIIRVSIYRGAPYNKSQYIGPRPIIRVSIQGRALRYCVSRRR